MGKKGNFDGRLAIGIVIGISFAILFFILFSRPDIDESTKSIILGALIAGFIGVVGQLLVIYSNHSANYENRKRQHKIEILQTFQSMTEILNSLASARDAIDSEDLVTSLKIGPFRYVKPTSIRGHINLLSKEEVLISLKFHDLYLNQMLTKLNIEMNKYNIYFRRYQVLYNKTILPAFEKLNINNEDGVVEGSVKLSQSELAKVKRALELLSSSVDESLLYSIFIVDHIGLNLGKSFDFNLKFELSVQNERIIERVNSIRASVSYQKRNRKAV